MCRSFLQTTGHKKSTKAVSQVDGVASEAHPRLATTLVGPFDELTPRRGPRYKAWLARQSLLWSIDLCSRMAESLQSTQFPIFALLINDLERFRADFQF